MVVRSGLWWFMVVCGSFSKILKKISCDPLFNQSESQDSVSNLILNETLWWFVVVCSGL